MNRAIITYHPYANWLSAAALTVMLLAFGVAAEARHPTTQLQTQTEPVAQTINRQ